MKIYPLKIMSYCVLGALAIASGMRLSGAADPDKHEYDDKEVYMRLVIRSNDQLSAFYVGREFPKKAIDEILKTCFITPIVKNNKYDALWVEPETWQFSVDGRSVERIKRDYWNSIWQEIELAQGHQATFGWTLMPETRDLRFDEGVGGSIVIPRQEAPFTLVANFKTGLNKEGVVKTIKFENISCAN